MARIPRSASYDERMLALAKRLGYKVPAPPLSATQWIRLWAYVGTELADKEPEFGPGPGRPLAANPVKSLPS